MLIFVCCISTANAEALFQESTFKHIRIEDGLSQSTVFCILQDRKGFLWFGTANGLNRYDGYNFQVFSNSPSDTLSLSDNGIHSILEDKNGFIWIGTAEGVLNRYDRKTGKFKRYYLSDNVKITKDPTSKYFEFPIPFSRNIDKTITAIAESPDNSIWIGTWGRGLFRLNTKNNSVEHFHFEADDKKGIQSNSIKSILADENVIWVGTLDDGLYKLDTKNNLYEWTNYKSNKSGKHSISDNKVISLLKDRNDDLWIGTFGGGLNKLPRGEQNKSAENASFFKIVNGGENNSSSNKIVTSIIQDKKGNIWAGTYGGGLEVLNENGEQIKNFKNDINNSASLSKNDVLSVFEDASGIIWVGTHLGKGISKLEGNDKKFSHIYKSANGLNDDVVWALKHDSDSVLWIGTYKGGLNKWDRKAGKFFYYKTDSERRDFLSDNHIRSIESDGELLLIGTYNGGLNILNKRTNAINKFMNNPADSFSIGGNQIQSILIDREKNYWIGTFGGGLNKLVKQSNSQKVSFEKFVFDPEDPFSLMDNRVYSLFEDGDGIIWVGTFGGGLARFDKNRKRFISYKNIPGDETSISDNRVMSIYEDKKGNLWVASYGGGLNKFDRKTEKFTRFDKKNKPSSSVVYGILEDDNNNLWMSTDNGIFKFNIESENFSRYDLRDGLQSLEFSGGAFCKSAKGEMFFGGINGFNYYFPDSIKDNYYVPPVVISAVKVFNQSFAGERDTIVLSYDQNFLSLEFSALDFTDPQDNQYAFMLEGLNNVWNYVDSRNRIANYANLLPGEYVFKVRGSNNDGIWNNIGAEIHLIIKPPFWRTWWFITGAVLFVAFIVYYLGSVRYRNLLAIEKIKTRLSADLHDNIGSGLTEISILSELASKEVEKISTDASKRLGVVSEKARHLIDNMSDIVWMVNPHRDSLYHLMLRLKDSYSDFMGALGISFSAVNFEKFVEVKLPMDYRQNLFLIFKEGINNALKHSKCKKIILEASVNKDILELTLRDDGIGIGKESVFGNGIQNMKNRAAAIGGELVLETSGKGTIIKFTGKSSSLYKIVSFFK